ncbi:MAG: exodeoxyribonuclease V subunit gamma, partial [Lysobacter sp.]|nr:exodeoxyribonuclease V subunit gamma [Lysobacter sp.]
FQGVLADADTRAPLLTGGVSFGRMVPMRLLPFRAICVLGMNDGDYPRRDPAGGLNQLTAELGTSARRRGDRSLRDDDRFLFLQLFAAAADVFYLSYLGADPREGSQREPSLLVAELIDAASRYHANPESAREQLVLRHPLQPFAPAAFGAAEGSPDSDPRRYSYRGEWHDAAGAGRAARRSLGRWITAPLAAAPTEESLTLAQLRSFLRDPSDAFLRQRLAMRLPEAADAIDDADPLAPPPRGLQRWQIQQAVFAACVLGQHDGLHARLRAKALLPSGPLGERMLAGLLAEVQPYAESYVQWRGSEPARSEAFELEFDGVRLTGSIDQVYRQGLARFRYDKLHGPAQITHGLDWLVLGALGHEVPLAQFCDTGAGPGLLLREPPEPASARAALRALLRLRAWGLRDPLPFSPRAGWLWYDGQRRLDAGEVPRANSRSPWQRAQDQWQPESGFGEGNTASTGVALRGRDPFGSSPADAELGEEFRRIASIVFDAVVHGRDTEAA